MQCKTFFGQLLIALTRTSPAFAPDRRKVQDQYRVGRAGRRDRKKPVTCINGPS